MTGINPSGSSSWHASRPDYLRVGSGGLMELKMPTTERAPNDVAEFRSEKELEQNQKIMYARARSQVEGDMTFSAGMGTLRIAAGQEGKARQATLTWKGEDGKAETLEFTISDDTRITWDENGAPVVLQGAQALEKGVLKAQGNNDFLIRVNAAVVQGGDAKSTVLNLSEKSGNFIGGKGGMTFWGSYKDSTITGGEGENRFAGVFTDSHVTGGAAKDTFSGFFARSIVKGGDSADSFSGIFFDKTEIFGEEGDDSFTGRFITAKLYGGGGSNYFGYQSGLGTDQAVQELNPNPDESSAGKLKTEDPSAETGYFFMEAAAAINMMSPKQAMTQQFVNVVIDTGDGDAELSGSFKEADITLGKGTNKIKGFAVDSRIDGSHAERNDMHLGFAQGSTVLSGSGDDKIQMVTGRENRIDAGDGDDTILLGDQKDQASNTLQLSGVTLDLPYTEFDTNPKWGGDPTSGNSPRVYHGTLEYNVVNASKGKNTVSVNTGDEDERFLSGELKDDDDEEKTEEQLATEEVDPTEVRPGTSAERARKRRDFAADSLAGPLGADPKNADDVEQPEDEEEEESEPGDLNWKFDTDNMIPDGQSTGAVQVIMSDSERRTFNQSYGSRKAKQRTYTNFASSNPGLWTA